MKRNFVKIFMYGLLALLFSNCGEQVSDKDNNGKYSIELGEFKSYDDAEVFKSKLDFKLWNELKIIQTEHDLFLLKYGKFISSYQAGRNGYELLSSGIVNNYKILKDSNNVPDLFANVLFVAKYMGRPSVYSYNIPSKKSKLLWSRWGRKVLAVNHSEDRNSVFITTALGYGKEGGFPYVRDTRLYLYTGEKDQVDDVAEFGDGLQLYTYWENKDTFKINITTTDSIKSEILIQKIIPFDLKGNEGIIHKRKFVITKDGFPVPPIYKPALLSTKGIFLLREVNDESEKFLYIRDVKNNAEVLLTGFNGVIKNLKWSDDEKFLIVILNNKIDEKGTIKTIDELIIIDTNDKKIIRSFKSSTFENLLVQGNLLFFDQQFQGNSQITVFDLPSDKIYDKIQISGGCGINNLLH